MKYCFVNIFIFMKVEPQVLVRPLCDCLRFGDMI